MDVKDQEGILVVWVFDQGGSGRLERGVGSIRLH